MLIIAHRGRRGIGAPENTLAAFAAAAALGVDGLETDVRMTADGEAVLFHDRLTPRHRLVADLARTHIEADCGHRVPSLADALGAFPEMFWNLEIKDADAVPATVAVLKRFSGRRLLVTSFRHHAVKQVAQSLAVDCGLLIAHQPLDARAMIAGCREISTLRAMVWYYEMLDATLAHEVTQAGWCNYAYGPVTQAEHERCTALGVAGVITDYPEYALQRREA
jgi:glycerophosphoryl diester phosphodiesterase